MRETRQVELVRKEKKGDVWGMWRRMAADGGDDDDGDAAVPIRKGALPSLHAAARAHAHANEHTHRTRLGRSLEDNDDATRTRTIRRTHTHNPHLPSIVPPPALSSAPLPPETRVAHARIRAPFASSLRLVCPGAQDQDKHRGAVRHRRASWCS